MQKIILSILLIFTLFSKDVKAQIGGLVTPSIPDTVYIQYLSKNGTEVNRNYSIDVAVYLKKDSIPFDFKYYQTQSLTRYVVRCWGKDRRNSLDVVQKIYGDAYFIDKRGWKVIY